ncbi:MAG: 4-hydroxy-tetrahydrodipicolinate synthase [Candidatus Latescibacterota bacterium]|jgi:4-hydroxy-tetrahydrodipicolinate synthase
MTDFKGVFPILITPFDDTGDVDLISFDRIIRFMSKIGVNGVTILGVLGESNRLTDAERESLIKTAIDAAEGQLPIIVGTSHSGTQATIQLSQMAETIGANGVMITPSREPIPNEQRIFEYIQQIGNAIGIPIVLQDHPVSTQVHMSTALILRMISEIPQIACIKEEATPTPPKITALRNGMDRPVPILTGLGALYGRFDLERGTDGFMTGFAFPEILIAMVNAAKEERWDDLQNIYAQHLPLLVYEQQPGVAIRKEIFRLRGLIQSSHVRHPGASIDPDTSAQLQHVLETSLPNINITQPLDV